MWREDFVQRSMIIGTKTNQLKGDKGNYMIKTKWKEWGQTQKKFSCGGA